MNISELTDIFNFLDTSFKEDFEEMYSSFDFFVRNFIDIKNKVSENLQEKIAQNSLDNTEEQLTYLKKIDSLIKDLETICKKYNPDDFADKEEPIKKPAEKINYDAYKVDNEEKHYLDEDFTNTKPFAFSFLGQKYITSQWKKFYLQTCEILIQQDSNKFKNLIYSFKGKAKPYLSYNAGKLRVPKELSNGMYIETNMSANDITGNIKTLLKEYDYKEKDFIIYLNKDYSDLHQEAKDLK